MEGCDQAEAAERSGVNVDELSQLVELGILKPDAENGSRRVICAARGS